MDVSVRPSAQVDLGDSQYAWRYFYSALAIAIIYSTVHIGARLLASPNLGEDDPLVNIYTQHLALGYGTDEPPLFTWIVYVVQLLTGPYLISFQLAKYVLLIATVGALFCCAYAVTRHAVWSLVTAEALTLIYHVGWRFHEGFAGLIPAMLCSMLALLFILRFVERQRSADAIGLGVACGLGLLSQYSFAIGIGAFVIAALLVKEVRTRLFCPKLFISLAVCLVLIAPHLAWIVGEPQRLSQYMSVYTALTHPDPRIDFWRVIKKTLAAPFIFYWSLLLILLFSAFGRVVRHFQTRLLPHIQWQGMPLLQFLGWYFVAVHVLLFAAGIMLSYVKYAYHDLLSMMLPTLVLLFALILQSQPNSNDMRRWAMVLLGVLSFALVARAANMFVMEPFCKLCRWGIPYKQLAQELRSSGFTGDGRIIGLEPDLVGNLRVYFPASQVSYRSLNALNMAWSQKLSGKPYVLVWQVGGKHGIRASRQTMRKHLDASGLALPIRIFNAPWQHLLRSQGYRQTEWNYVISPAPASP